MNPVSSNAVLAHHVLDPSMCADWQREAGAEASTDLAATTSTGRIADLISLSIENSGSSRFYIVNFRLINTGIVSLLRRWIDEYGDDEDRDLDLQLAELSSNRLALRERC